MSGIFVRSYIILENLYWWTYTYLQGRNRDADIENRLVETAREGEGGTNGESSIETYTLPYVQYIASGNLLYNAGNSNPVLCDKLEGGMGWKVGGRIIREGTYVYLRLIHVDIWQKLTKYCKAIILQFKNKIIFLKTFFKQQGPTI